MIGAQCPLQELPLASISMFYCANEREKSMVKIVRQAVEVGDLVNEGVGYEVTCAHGVLILGALHAHIWSCIYLLQFDEGLAVPPLLASKLCLCLSQFNSAGKGYKPSCSTHNISQISSKIV